MGYNPVVGTFVERDPVEADPNAYRYVENGPTCVTDPSGMAEVTQVPRPKVPLKDVTPPHPLAADPTTQITQLAQDGDKIIVVLKYKTGKKDGLIVSNDGLSSILSHTDDRKFVRDFLKIAPPLITPPLWVKPYRSGQYDKRTDAEANLQPYLLAYDNNVKTTGEVLREKTNLERPYVIRVHTERGEFEIHTWKATGRVWQGVLQNTGTGVTMAVKYWLNPNTKGNVKQYDIVIAERFYTMDNKVYDELYRDGDPNFDEGIHPQLRNRPIDNNTNFRITTSIRNPTYLGISPQSGSTVDAGKGKRPREAIATLREVWSNRALNVEYLIGIRCLDDLKKIQWLDAALVRYKISGTVTPSLPGAEPDKGSKLRLEALKDDKLRYYGFQTEVWPVNKAYLKWIEGAYNAQPPGVRL
jgi:hypothetical protein